MRLILDAVFNHASSDGLYFDRYHRYAGDIGACESLSSPYRNWFQFRNSNIPCGDFDYESFLGIDTLPSFDSSNPEVRNFFYASLSNSVLAHWYQQGAAGWRFDFSDGPPPNFWREMRPFAKAMRSDGPLIAESFSNASRFLLGDQFDSTINNRFRRDILGFVRERDKDDDSGIIEAMLPSEFDHALAALREEYPPQATAVLLNVLDHHDTNRALFLLTENGDKGLSEAKKRSRLAALFQFTYIGAPMVFYGDEAAINAPTLTPPEHDPYSRAPYPWEDETGDVHVYGPPDHEMIGYYQSLAALRRGHSALRTGSFVTLLTGDTSWPNNDDTTYAFARSNDHEVVIVILNKGKLDNKPSVPVGDYFADGTILRDALTGKTVSVSGGRIELTLAARAGAVLLKI
jgi:glycosidase